MKHTKHTFSPDTRYAGKTNPYVIFQDEDLLHLRACMAAAQYAFDSKDVRFCLRGISLNDKHVVGTNGHILCMAPMPQDRYNFNFEDIENTLIISTFKIPKNCIMVAIVVNDTLTEARVTLHTKNTHKTIEVLLIEGKYPNYMQVMDSKPDVITPNDPSPYSMDYAYVGEIQKAIGAIGAVVMPHHINSYNITYTVEDFSVRDNKKFASYPLEGLRTRLIGMLL
ncbi:MAG: hypothetical protein GY941_21040 [Planctomycetes bacterium]|nr:hypothetical protein [Planctomycetota bacterium]